MAVTDQDTFTIAGKQLTSRLLLGTGGFRSLDTMAADGERVLLHCLASLVTAYGLRHVSRHGSASLDRAQDLDPRAL